MNTQTQEALKMAIAALSEGAYGKEREKAIQACKEALAQPQPKLFLDLSNSNGNHPVQQEPVAWMNPSNGAVICKQKKKQIGLDGKVNGYKNFSVPLTDHPALSWQGLTDENGVVDFGDMAVTREFIRGALWADAKLRDVNSVGGIT